MFKKRNLKGSNFAQDMGALGTSHPKQKIENDNEDPEPVIQKKVKTAYGAKYSVRNKEHSVKGLTLN